MGNRSIFDSVLEGCEVFTLKMKYDGHFELRFFEVEAVMLVRNSTEGYVKLKPINERRYGNMGMSVQADHLGIRVTHIEDIHHMKELENITSLMVNERKRALREIEQAEKESKGLKVLAATDR